MPDPVQAGAADVHFVLLGYANGHLLYPGQENGLEESKQVWDALHITILSTGSLAFSSLRNARGSVFSLRALISSEEISDQLRYLVLQ